MLRCTFSIELISRKQTFLSIFLLFSPFLCLCPSLPFLSMSSLFPLWLSACLLVIPLLCSVSLRSNLTSPCLLISASLHTMMKIPVLWHTKLKSQFQSKEYLFSRIFSFSYTQSGKGTLYLGFYHHLNCAQHIEHMLLLLPLHSPFHFHSRNSSG